ncbi:MAG TPA: tRNA lysidine(34) synthetase TilS [Methylophilaceae bacterium]|nr:tRNA lysidine(34) synthetase TilS [Methylophilaceae bacterium]
MASSRKLRSAELPARLESFLKQAVRPGQTLLLGLSGGLDSRVLLDLLQRLRATAGFHLQALHVNHGISPKAAEWEGFCADLCASLAIPFQTVCVDIPRDSGLGLEATAREARYAVLLAQPVDAVVLAHQRDDQAETLLLQLLRGAGLKGLAAMPVIRASANGQPVLLRPLLDVPRDVLEDYARGHQLRWIEDESNLDLTFDRNFLRHHIFPELERRFPASRTTLARSASHLAEADALLREVAEADAGRLVRDGRLEVAGLAAMSEARAKNLLRYWLDSHGAATSSRRLQEMYRQL